MVVCEQGREEIQHEVRGMFLTEVLAANVYCEPASGFCDMRQKTTDVYRANLGTA